MWFHTAVWNIIYEPSISPVSSSQRPSETDMISIPTMERSKVWLRVVRSQVPGLICARPVWAHKPPLIRARAVSSHTINFSHFRWIILPWNMLLQTENTILFLLNTLYRNVLYYSIMTTPTARPRIQFPRFDCFSLFGLWFFVCLIFVLLSSLIDIQLPNNCWSCQQTYLSDFLTMLLHSIFSFECFNKSNPIVTHH